MSAMTPGAALRELQVARGNVRKARELLKQYKDASPGVGSPIAACWQSLQAAHRVLSAIPLGAADDEVLTKQLALARYATALLVRLRRLMRQGSVDSLADDDSHAWDDEIGED